MVKLLAIFGFSVPNYVYMVTFGRKIIFANFQSLGPLLGLSHAELMYQSISSLTIPPGRPPGIRTFSLPGGPGFAQLSLPGGRGFELQKFSTVLKENRRNFSICFKEIGGSLKAGVLVLFHVNFCKNSRCLLYL